jgi:hypothetical protein
MLRAFPQQLYHLNINKPLLIAAHNTKEKITIPDFSRFI